MKDYVVLGVVLLAGVASPAAIAPDLASANTPLSTQLLDARDATVTQAIASPSAAVRTEAGADTAQPKDPNFPQEGGTARA